MLWPHAAAPPRTTASGLDPKKVVVAVFVNQTGDASLDALGIQISDYLTQCLTRMSVAVAINPEVPSVGGPGLPRAVLASQRAPLQALAERTGAGLVVTGAYYLEGDSLRVQSRIVDAATGVGVVPLDPAVGQRSKSSELLTRLANLVTGALAHRLNTSQLFGSGYRPAPHDAYLEWVQGVTAWGTNGTEAVRHIQAALELDPDFSLARVFLVGFLNLTNRPGDADMILRPAEEPAAYSRATPFEQAWIRVGRVMVNGDLTGLDAASAELVRLAPSPITLYGHALIARSLHHPRAALALLARIKIEDSPAAWGPGASRFLENRASIHHELGEYSDGLADARLGQQHYPAEAPFFAEEIAAMIALGRVGEIDAVLARCAKATVRSGSTGETMYAAARELAAHGYADAAKVMAARASAWYKGRLDTGKATLSLRASYANALLLAGDCQQGLKIWHDLARDAPDNLHYQGIYATSLVACGGSRDQAKEMADALAK